MAELSSFGLVIPCICPNKGICGTFMKEGWPFFQHPTARGEVRGGGEVFFAPFLLCMKCVAGPGGGVFSCRKGPEMASPRCQKRGSMHQMAVAQKAGIPKWVALRSGNMGSTPAVCPSCLTLSHTIKCPCGSSVTKASWPYECPGHLVPSPKKGALSLIFSPGMWVQGQMTVTAPGGGGLRPDP